MPTGARQHTDVGLLLLDQVLTALTAFDEGWHVQPCNPAPNGEWFGADVYPADGTHRVRVYVTDPTVRRVYLVVYDGGDFKTDRAADLTGMPASVIADVIRGATR